MMDTAAMVNGNFVFVLSYAMKKVALKAITMHAIETNNVSNPNNNLLGNDFKKSSSV